LVPAGSYTLTMNFGTNYAATPGETEPVEVLVDGQLIATQVVPAQWGGTFTVPVGALAAGQHSVSLIDAAPAGNAWLNLGGGTTPIVSLMPAQTSVSVTVPASAGANPVTGTSTVLSVQAADPNYPASSLTYIWSATSVPAGAAPPSFSVNGTGAAQQTTATFSQAGSYNFLVTIADPGGATATSTVGVTVNPTLTTIIVSPATATVPDGTTETLTATAFDQFGQALVSQPLFAWSVDPGGAGGTIDTSGLYTGPDTGTGSDTVGAGSGAVTGTAARGLQQRQ
jgi:hypothetical protein